MQPEAQSIPPVKKGPNWEVVSKMIDRMLEFEEEVRTGKRIIPPAPVIVTRRKRKVNNSRRKKRRTGS